MTEAGAQQPKPKSGPRKKSSVRPVNTGAQEEESITPKLKSHSVARDIVVIGASAGGVEALCVLMKQLPADLRASVFVVLHLGHGKSYLSEILERCGSLPASVPKEREKIARGRIYVAPSDRHLIISDGHVALSRAPRENRHRPAVDALFRSAARIYRERVIGVVLTGALDDGCAGLFAIKSRGGIAIVQDPQEAVQPAMPRNALRHVDVDYCVRLAKMGPLLAKLVRTKVPAHRAEAAQEKVTREKTPGFREDAVSFVCPECQGPLYARRNGDLVQFGCQVGHAFSPESLSEAHSDALERALWIAVRTLNERIAIHEALAEKQRMLKNDTLADRLAEGAAGAANDAKLVREIINRL